MNMLIIGGVRTDNGTPEALTELREHMEETLMDASIQAVFLDDIIYDITPEAFRASIASTGQSLDEFDAIYIRGPKMRLRSDQAYYVSRFCKANGIRCVNDYSLYYPGTKVAQTMLFFEEAAPFLDTIYAATNSNVIEAAEERFGYPYILKTITGSHGDANYLVRSRDEAEEAVKKDASTDFLAQRYCENDRDYRVLVTPTDSLIFARRGTSDTHLNNTSKGAEAEIAAPSEVPSEIIELSRRLGARLHLELAGVDVMPRLHTDEFYVLEVNSQPQLRTGAFLDEKKQLIQGLFAERTAADS